MIAFKNDYSERVVEISAYFSFLEYIDNIESHKNLPIKYNDSEFKVSRDLQKILRANVYILLYNLVESTIRNSIQLVHDKINDENLKLEDISDRLREIWITAKVKSLPVSENNLKNWVKDLMFEFSDDLKFANIQDSINISGNLDYDNIQLIINKFGFFGSLKNSKQELLQTFSKVKFERNKLAHGNKRFCQSGEIITINDLLSLKKIVVSFLDDYTDNVIDFIKAKKYLK